jgi:hypothetical protein
MQQAKVKKMSIQSIFQLVKAGFEYVTGMEGIKLFRKQK